MMDQEYEPRQQRMIYLKGYYNSPSILHLLVFLFVVLTLVTCSSLPSTSSRVTVQPALPTPTLEPTFTPSPSLTNALTPSPIPTTKPTLTPLPQASLSGRILDQNSGQPIAEAEVHAGTISTTTNGDGRYTLTGLPPGQYVLSVTHPDYDPGLSSIYTLAATEELEVDLALYAPDTSPYPQDPMLTNPLDPNGAPTEKDAERLAREQGLTGKVVSIAETKLSGEYLVNYKIGDDIRAAVAELNHEAWELTDDTGRTWWIIKVCGNLASPLPQVATITTPIPRPLPPLAEVVVNGVSVRACASEECAEVGTIQRGAQVEVFGCLADGGWCEVGWSGGRGWCTGRSLRHLAVTTVVPVVKTILPTATPGVVASGEGKIVFESGRDHIEQIYVINPDGSGLTRLTNHERHDQKPVWSPDGQKIAFQSASNLNFEIYVMNVDGSSLRQLTDNPGQDWMPVWSPDSKRIAFWSERERKNNFHIFLINADGSGLRQLVEDDSYFGQDRNPTWSPDSQQIAFEYLNSDIYVINADGTGLKALSHDKETVLDYGPAWSPDGQKIAFNCYWDNKNEICVMNADGSGKTNLTNHPASDTGPIWSPDSQKIAFTSDRDGNQEIYVMNADGSGLTRLTYNPRLDSNHPGLDYGPTWSPDSRRITFVSWPSDYFGHSIYIINVDGSGLVRLTDYINDNWPNWSP